MRKASSKLTMVNIMSNPTYKGKHVIVVAGKVFTAKTGKEANRILDMVEKKYPKEIPAMTYIPKFETLFSSNHKVTFSTK